VGRVGGKPLVQKLGRYVLVTQGDVDRAERFLAGRGSWAISVGRMLPFIRAFTSIVAGLVRVPAVRFGVFSLIGTVIYATVLSVIGYQVGHAWGSINHGLTVATYILVAIVVIAIVGFVLYRLRQFRREAAQDKDQAQAKEDRGAAAQEPAAQAPTAQAQAPRRPGRHRSDAEV
jgi:membrane protein DedA with SNARE-associated domain